MKQKTCRDCGCREGEPHQLGCGQECCPFCGGQLISCNCHLTLLGYKPHKITSKHPTLGLPKHIYEDGLPVTEHRKFVRMLEKKGRIPYIRWPVLCASCGKKWPEMFMVPDEEWAKYIQPDKRDEVVCRKCYDHIKELIDRDKNE